MRPRSPGEGLREISRKCISSKEFSLWKYNEKTKGNIKRGFWFCITEEENSR